MENKITYNKLVRDKIPQIIESSGRKHQTYIAEDQEYRSRLLSKLVEEAQEFLDDPCLEEMADILEVIEAIKVAFHFTDDAIEDKRLEKKSSRGAFDQKLILEYVYET